MSPGGAPWVALAATLALGCDSAASTDAPDVAHYISAGVGAGRWSPGTMLQVKEPYPRLALHEPVRLLAGPAPSGGWYVLERQGRVVHVDDRADVERPSVVLDLRHLVQSEPTEAGLLGIAFHPRYPEDARLFLSYTTGSERQLVSTLAQLAAPPGKPWRVEDLQVLLTLEQPYVNHNGGNITFGPDGRLYLGFGDGGSAGDPHDNGQNLHTWFGKMLRLDVDHPAPPRRYGIPADNPWADGKGAAPEVWAYGLRNPWTFSFDRPTGRLWAADVGQYLWEEVDVVSAGHDYGWRQREGRHCFNPEKGCKTAGMIDPITEYSHAAGDKSITGGFVYRGRRIEGLAGNYVYADFATGRVWAIPADPPPAQANGRLIAKTERSIPGFGEGADGEIYFLDFYDGKILTLVAEQPE